jgi:Ca2+-binding EF-hand superfamily protein
MSNPWIAKIAWQRQKENEKNKSIVNINHKIRKFSSQQKLEQAAVMFIVKNNSSNNTAKQLREVFKIIDKSGDGRLTYDEPKMVIISFLKIVI